jgi:macrolide transport system ATP-binding/permease protein
MAWLSRFRAIFGKEKLSQEHEEELQFHLSMRERLNVDQGMTPGQARTDARLRFGNPSLWRERMSEIDLMVLPATVLQDVRYGVRMFWRNAGSTLVAVLALGIGIGVNTAAFTAYKAFFKRSLDARDSGRMVNLALLSQSGAGDKSGDFIASFSIPDYEGYRDQVHSFSGLIAMSIPQNLTLTGAGGISTRRSTSNGALVSGLGLLPSVNNIETAVTFLVSENYFSVLGVGAPYGRTFAAADTSALAASPSALISENYWQKRFGRDPAILGKTVRLNGIAFTIVGITPHNFVGTSVVAPDFWLPLSVEPLVHPDDNWLRNRETLCCRVYGRLASNAGMGQALAEMNIVAGHLSTLHGPHSNLRKPTKAEIWPGSPFPYPLKQFGGLEYGILLIMVGVGMVLVIACANVASLQLARAASRQHELSMRLSLGASRLRIIRQLLTESALLGLVAGAVALLFSWAFLQTVVVVVADAFPDEYGTFIFHVTPDLGVFSYVFCLSLLAGILFGLAPALESSGSAVSSALKTNARIGKVRSRRMRDVLTAAQVAVSLVLLIAGSMFIRSAIRAVKMDTGYDTQHTLSLELRFPEGERYSIERRATLVRELQARLISFRGVVSITSARAPDGGEFRTAAVSVNGEKPTPQNTQAILYYTYIQPNYFQTLSIPLLYGHGFEAQTSQPEHAVILSASAAQLLWPGQNPLGHSLRLASGGRFKMKDDAYLSGPAYQVIGVARDTRGVLLDGSDSEQIYLPMPKDRIQDSPILIRSQAAPMQIMNTIAPIISSIDPNLAAYTFTLENMLHTTDSFIASSISATIASSIGILGLLLALMGIYGTVSHLVVLRTREVGIRMALGARKRDVLILMLREGTRPVVVGLIVGVCLALGASYLLRGVLYGLKTIDVIPFITVSILFLAIALFAAYLPSRRAMRVEPMVALRYE